jgi:Fe-S cluster assembly protein SufD
MEEKLWAAHVALLSDGYLLYVPRDVQIPAPVHCFRCITAGGILVSSHSLIIAEEGAEVTCIDEFLSPDLSEPSIGLAGAELFSGSNAMIRYISLQRYNTSGCSTPRRERTVAWPGSTCAWAPIWHGPT